jgi:3-deoxy-D-manno-octulosonic-acid transferase
LVRRILIVAPISGKIKQFVDGRKRIWDDLKNIPNDKEVVWMHCASLGEYEQGLPILHALKAREPKTFYLVTFFSPSGYHANKAQQVANLTTFLPWDHPSDVRRFVQIVKPTKVFIIKYEFWPNLLLELHNQKIPTFLIAGLFRPHQTFFKPWGGQFCKLLKSFSHIFVQNQPSKELLNDIGITQVSVSGDTRFDRVQQQKQDLPFIKSFIGNRKCIVAGSTWSQDIAVLKDIIAQTPKDWCWLIAPHDINDQRIESLINGLPPESQRYTQCETKLLSKTPVLVLDTIGLLSSCYQYAQIAYVGGGMGTKGLHNILEPAAAGIPIVIGKNYTSFPEAVSLIKAGGVISISNAREAKKKLLSFIHDGNHRKETGVINLHFIRANLGATKKVLDILG